MMPTRIGLLAATLSSLMFVARGYGQDQPGEALHRFIQGNETFGLRLLEQVHSEDPERNAVVAPISLSILLAAIQANVNNMETREQMGTAFGWGAHPDLRTPSRMVLAAINDARAGEVRYRMPGEPVPEQEKGMWITNRLLFRSPQNVPPLLTARFMEVARDDFGLEWIDTGERNPAVADLRQSRKAVGKLPEFSATNQVWLSSGTELRQEWERLFKEMKEPRDGDFTVASGKTKLVKVLDSGTEEFRYANTEMFEAVELPCGRVYMLGILPKPGVEMKELEHQLASTPGLVDSVMHKSLGAVTLPVFEIQKKVQLADSFRAIGIRDIFANLDGIFRTRGARITDVAQSIHLIVDKHGIRANAETLIGAIPAGMIIDPEPFHLWLNRPFIVLVRDYPTNALLFAGVLMDPVERPD